jgi:hypothetical protein
VEVAPVRSKKDLEEFIHLPWRIYAGNGNWVPPLLYTEKRRFDPKHNAFFKHADVRLLLARRGGQVAGRITAQVDSEHNKFHAERTGFFGFLECIDDPLVAKELLQSAEGWLREQGMETVRGPLNFSVNGEIGFLVEGHDSPPMPLMPYTHAYYLPLVEAAGYEKAKDLYADGRGAAVPTGGLGQAGANG